MQGNLILETAIALSFPVLVVYIWEYCTSRIYPLSWATYVGTGIIGTPVHELSHAFACLMFGMRIQAITLFSPNKATGVLGSVGFTYARNRTWHAFGLVVQGFAPMITAAVAIVLMIQHLSIGSELSLEGGARDALYSIDAAFTGSLIDMVLMLLVGIVCMHGIPSIADIAIAARGGFALSGLMVSLGVAFEAFRPDDLLPDGMASSVAHNILNALETGFSTGVAWAVYGFSAVATMAIVTSTVLLLIPAVAQVVWNKLWGVR